MPIQSRPQTLLIEVMRNETNTPAQHEQAIEHAILEIILGFFGREGSAVAKQVDEADGDAAVDVEDQVVLLGGCDGLDGDGVVEELGGWEVLLAVFLHQLDAEVGVVAGFDAVADAGNYSCLSATVI